MMGGAHEGESPFRSSVILHVKIQVPNKALSVFSPIPTPRPVPKTGEREALNQVILNPLLSLRQSSGICASADAVGFWCPRPPSGSCPAITEMALASNVPSSASPRPTTKTHTIGRKKLEDLPKYKYIDRVIWISRKPPALTESSSCIKTWLWSVRSSHPQVPGQMSFLVETESAKHWQSLRHSRQVWHESCPLDPRCSIFVIVTATLEP